MENPLNRFNLMDYTMLVAAVLIMVGALFVALKVALIGAAVLGGFVITRALFNVIANMSKIGSSTSADFSAE